MHGELTGKVALITGASKNIGRAAALQLAQAGAHVAIHYQTDSSGAEETKEVIRAFGGHAEVFQADLRNVNELQTMVTTINSSFGRVDILINNAAIRPRTSVAQITENEWDDVISTNLKAPFFLTKYCSPEMIQNKWGRIINISGIDAHWGKANRAHGVSSKAGLIGLTRATALEFARHGITVNAVVPGLIDTKRTAEWYPELDRLYQEAIDRIPAARLGTPDEVASACLYLAKPQAAYITGQTINVTGGAGPLVRLPYDEEVQI